MSYARSIGDDVVAMHVSTAETAKKDAEVAEEFADYFPDIRFETVTTSYRNIITPTVQYVIKVAKRAKKEGRTVTVLVPQFIPKKSWQNILHNKMSLKLKFYLKCNEDV